MNPSLHATLIAFSIPIACSLIAALMMLMDAHLRHHHLAARRLRQLVAATFLMASFGWAGWVVYALEPNVFMHRQYIFLLIFFVGQAMLYKVISILTGTGERRTFNYLYVVVPLFIILFVATQPRTMTTLFIIGNALYPALNLVNLYHYRRFIVNYSADAYRTSLSRLAFMQLLILIIVPIPLTGLMAGSPIIPLHYLSWLGALPYAANYLILCYNLISNNILVIRPEPTDADTTVKAMSLKRFEHYLQEKKPYLHPKLRITEMAAELHTNRSYLSNYINEKYGMNFSRFINRCRLEELDRLRLSASNADKSNLDLVLMAGFGSYRSYLRAKEEDVKFSLRLH